MNIPIELVALILLLIHAGSVAYMVNVLRKQWKLKQLPLDTSMLLDPTTKQKADIKHFRNVLFVLSIIILVGNLIPILVDLVTIFFNNSIGRTRTVKPISLLYALSNGFTQFVSAYLINMLYKLSLSSDIEKSDIIKASNLGINKKKGT